MVYYVYKNQEEIAGAVATIFASTLFEKPDAIFGLATGSTPIPTYQRLIALNRDGLIDFSRARTYNLDEYVGLGDDHDQSYRFFMNEQLFDHINIDKKNTHVPSGLGDVEQNAREYDQMIEAAGGIDLQLLGIGHNGHIGFNEPSDAFVYETNVTTLTESTIQANARNFAQKSDVPTTAISLGIGGIMKARRVVLIATGKGKAEAILGAIKGSISPRNPASALQFHGNVQFFLDEEAASLL